MGKDKIKDLLPDPMLESRFRQGCRIYERRYVKCGKENCWCAKGLKGGNPGHGPYWYLCASRAGKWVKVYLGVDVDVKRYIDSEGAIDWEEVRYGREGTIEQADLQFTPHGERAQSDAEAEEQRVESDCMDGKYTREAIQGSE